MAFIDIDCGNVIGRNIAARHRIVVSHQVKTFDIEIADRLFTIIDSAVIVDRDTGNFFITSSMLLSPFAVNADTSYDIVSPFTRVCGALTITSFNSYACLTSLIFE